MHTEIVCTPTSLTLEPDTGLFSCVLYRAALPGGEEVDPHERVYAAALLNDFMHTASGQPFGRYLVTMPAAVNGQVVLGSITKVGADFSNGHIVVVAKGALSTNKHAPVLLYGPGASGPLPDVVGHEEADALTLLQMARVVVVTAVTYDSKDEVFDISLVRLELKMPPPVEPNATIEQTTAAKPSAQMTDPWNMAQLRDLNPELRETLLTVLGADEDNELATARALAVLTTVGNGAGMALAMLMETVKGLPTEGERATTLVCAAALLHGWLCKLVENSHGQKALLDAARTILAKPSNYQPPSFGVKWGSR